MRNFSFTICLLLAFSATACTSRSVVEQGLEAYEREDFDKAFELFSSAALEEDARAKYYLGRCYEKGQGTEPDSVRALHWYVEAANGGNGDAQLSLADYYARNDDKDAAFHWCKKAAEQGIAQAQYRLGCFYRDDYGVMSEEEKAAEWFKKAVAQGNTDAMVALGRCYEYGKDGVDKNYYEAYSLFTKAAEQDNADAIYYKGIMLMHGYGVDADPNRGFELQKEAAIKGSAVAQGKLAFANLLMKDYEAAFYWAKKGAPQGDGEAQSVLARCYLYGHGTEKNVDEGFDWLYKSACQGNQYDQDLMGWCCFEGGHYNKAYKWFSLAARNPSPDASALWHLGMCLYNGYGTEKDEAKGLEYIRKAASRHNIEACVFLEANNLPLKEE